MRSQFTILLSLFFMNIGAFAQQYVISGTVKDADTGETLPFANVFFAETTFGVNTDNNGQFELKVSQSGTYDLIVRFVGYQTYGLNIRLDDQFKIQLDVSLKPDEVNLGSVTVTARNEKDWQRYLKEFKELFLGYSRNAAQCKILNEQDIDFYFDKDENKLYGFSKQAIRVENKALGYYLDFYLEDFNIDYNKNLSTYYGYTAFREMESNSKRKQRIWQENRQKAYEGSLQHFFASVFEGKLSEEGYIVQAAKDIKGFGRVLNPQNVNVKDFIEQGQTDLSKQLPFENFLYVTYTKEKETPEYVQNFKPGGRMNTVSASKLGEQVSWIALVEGKESIEFERTGYLYDPLAFYSQGYWGFEKVADMVPINYKPKQ